jgi:hypothetical protein
MIVNAFTLQTKRICNFLCQPVVSYMVLKPWSQTQSFLYLLLVVVITPPRSQGKFSPLSWSGNFALKENTSYPGQKSKQIFYRANL